MSKPFAPLTSANLSTPVSQDLAVAGDVISRTNMPPEILGGIADLFITFDAGKKISDDDVMRKIEICAEALLGLEIPVVEHVLRRMRRFNPRNPFPPTAQDLYEECGRVRGIWRRRIIDTMIGGNEWGPPSGSYSVGASSSDPWGPPPFTTGCYVPKRMIIETLTEYIDSNASDPDSKLARLDPDAFARLPDCVFGPGRREAALAARALHAGRLESQQREEARQRWWDGLGRPMREAITRSIPSLKRWNVKSSSTEGKRLSTRTMGAER